MTACATCVIHLVWAPLGIQPLEEFIASYRAHRAGANHRLLVVYNGFEEGADLRPFRDALAGVDHSELLLSRPVQDIEAYFTAAASCQERRLCFLNSYARILTSDWLEKLERCLASPGVGAVAASGSAESHLTSAWRYTFSTAPRSGVAGRLRQARHLVGMWRRFRAFPNFHLRTNAFMIERERFTELRRKSGPIIDKFAAEAFESGRSGLTAQVLREGLSVRVVGEDGHCYQPAEWAASRTFRSGAQENLLVADNRTRQYAEGDEATRRMLADLAWGSEAVIRG